MNECETCGKPVNLDDGWVEWLSDTSMDEDERYPSWGLRLCHNTRTCPRYDHLYGPGCRRQNNHLWRIATNDRLTELYAFTPESSATLQSIVDTWGDAAKEHPGVCWV